VNTNNKWWTLLAVCVATFMLLLDVTIVNVALKSIQDDLHSKFSDLQWVVDAYALTLASFLLTWGSVADIVGRRRIFLVGIAIFTAASLVCGLATSPLMLNVSRAAQGVGAAAMFATALALLAQEFHGAERGTAFGIWGAVTGAAVAVGPLIGGALTDSLGWESIFFVNVPVGLIAIGLTAWQVRDSHVPRPGARVDWLGLITFSVALFCLILALIQGNDKGWGSSEIVGLLVAAGILLGAFVAIEATVRQPMLDLKLFRKPTFIGASAAAFTLSASIFSLFLYVTLYFQNVLGFAPLATGLRFLPTTLLSFVVAAVAGKASAHLPVRALMGFGLLFVGIGLVLIDVMVEPSSHWTTIMVGLCVAGLGIGLTNPPLASTAVGVVEPQRSGMASGINSTFRQIGIATGIAGLGAIFQHQIAQQVTQRLAGSFEPADVQTIAHGVTNGTAGAVLDQLPDQARAVAVSAMQESFVHALGTISLVGGIVALAGSFMVFGLVRASDFVHTRQTGAPAQE